MKLTQNRQHRHKSKKRQLIKRHKITLIMALAYAFIIIIQFEETGC